MTVKNVLGEHNKKLRARKKYFWKLRVAHKTGKGKLKKRGLSRFRHLGIALSFLHLQSILHMILHFLLSMLLGRYLRVLLLKAGFHWRRS